MAKYINSNENLVYSKKKHLFALNLAKQSDSKQIILVEGYMDAISLYQRGFNNVVASLGTALTEEQGRLLRKYSEQVVLSYDSDGAGQEAIMRGLSILENQGCDARVLQMEGAKDPDEYVIKYGSGRFKLLIENDDKYKSLFIELCKYFNKNSDDSKIMLESLILQLIYRLKVDAVGTHIFKDQQSAKAETVKKVVNYVKGHLDEDLSLKTLSKIYSRYVLCY